mmetsp:Transcript_39100/g.103833  ORF Transcript_39100/g.103833 Transcript_39100/m.103833 type:complete len:379 (-) Transcript_39100:24-1160(-)
MKAPLCLQRLCLHPATVDEPLTVQLHAGIGIVPTSGGIGPQRLGQRSRPWPHLGVEVVFVHLFAPHERLTAHDACSAKLTHLHLPRTGDVVHVFIQFVPLMVGRAPVPARLNPARRTTVKVGVVSVRQDHLVALVKETHCECPFKLVPNLDNKLVWRQHLDDIFLCEEVVRDSRGSRFRAAPLDLSVQWRRSGRCVCVSPRDAGRRQFREICPQRIEGCGIVAVQAQALQELHDGRARHCGVPASGPRCVIANNHLVTTKVMQVRPEQADDVGVHIVEHSVHILVGQVQLTRRWLERLCGPIAFATNDKRTQPSGFAPLPPLVHVRRHVDLRHNPHAEGRRVRHELFHVGHREVFLGSEGAEFGHVPSTLRKELQGKA